MKRLQLLETVEEGTRSARVMPVPLELLDKLALLHESSLARGDVPFRLGQVLFQDASFHEVA